MPLGGVDSDAVWRSLKQLHRCGLNVDILPFIVHLRDKSLEVALDLKVSLLVVDGLVLVLLRQVRNVDLRLDYRGLPLADSLTQRGLHVFLLDLLRLALRPVPSLLEVFPPFLLLAALLLKQKSLLFLFQASAQLLVVTGHRRRCFDVAARLPVRVAASEHSSPLVRFRLRH